MNLPANQSDMYGENELSFRAKIQDVGQAFRESWHDEEFVGKTTLVGAIATQLYERARIPEIIAPPIAIQVLENTNGNTLLTGLALGGVVMAQQMLIGSVWAETLSRFEKVTERITTNFPKTAEFAEDIGPSPDRKWYSNIREGLSGFFSFGTTPFLIAQKTYQPDMTRKDMHKTSARISMMIGMIGVNVGMIAAEAILVSPPEYQDDIVNVLEKPYLWMGLAAVYELPRLFKKRKARRRMNKQET